MSKVVLLIKLVNVFTKNFLFLGDRPNSNSNVILVRNTLLRKNVLINVSCTENGEETIVFDFRTSK